MSLLDWGWGAYCAQQPETSAIEAARVIAPFGQQFLIATEVGEQTAGVSGRLRSDASAGRPVVGDWVAMRMGFIDRVLPRNSQLARIAPGNTHQVQVLASNVDLLFITTGLDHDFNLRRLERYLVLAAASGAEPVIVLTKADLCADPGVMIRAASEIAGQKSVILSSALDGAGAEELRNRIGSGRTAALLGSSGTGKSTLVNLLLKSEPQRVQEVRVFDSRGRHTTTHRQMFRIPGGGLLIDQPGLREIQIAAQPEALDKAFADITEVAQSCRFRDCRHESEPGCAVQEMSERGEIDNARLKSFSKLRREAERAEEETDPVARAERKNKVKAVHRAMRGHYRQ